jgi:hypothetical protein
MAGIYEKDQVGKREDLADILSCVVAEETPFTSMLSKEGKPSNKIMNYQAKRYPNRAFAGVMDGEDVSTYNEQAPRAVLTAVCQKFVEPWMVSDFADEAVVAGLPKGEKGEQKAAALINLKFAIEGKLLSATECSVDDGGSTPNVTRGAINWLSADAQAVYPVDSNFRTPTGCRFTSALSGLTEAAFQNLLAAAWTSRRGVSVLDGFVGITLKRVFDNWSSLTDAGASFATFPVRTFNQSAESKALVKVIDILKFSEATVRLHPSAYIAKDSSTGADTAYTPRSGLFLDMAMWKLAWTRKPRMVDLEDKGGGPRGFADAILGLKCFNPLGQCLVYSGS